MGKARLAVLDRDGVINRDSDDYIKSPEEWVALPGSLEAIACLNRAGWRVVIASNQSGIGRGLFDVDALMAIQQKFEQELMERGGRIDGFFFCPHAPAAHCRCRKPKPGLLEDIAARFQIDLDGVPVIGDKRSDIEAARAAGARPILVLTGRGAETAASVGPNDCPEVYADLSAAARALIQESGAGR